MVRLGVGRLWVVELFVLPLFLPGCVLVILAIALLVAAFVQRRAADSLAAVLGS